MLQLSQAVCNHSLFHMYSKFLFGTLVAEFAITDKCQGKNFDLQKTGPYIINQIDQFCYFTVAVLNLSVIFITRH